MPTVTMIQHINVPISDRAKTREWYERVLGARFRDRGPRLDARQLQMHLGNAEIHFTEGRREDTGEHYTYIHDPDGNLIELVYHPLGIEDCRIEIDMEGDDAVIRCTVSVHHKTGVEMEALTGASVAALTI